MASPKPQRLDLLMVELGLADNRTRARALIMARSVLVDGQVSDKPGTSVRAGATVTLKAKLKYVSRGGLKLEPAFDEFGVDPDGRVCLDVGASTGGFTDCLLQRGAKKVWAVDVGKGILDWRLRNDERVVVLEGVNARYLTPAQITDPIELVVVDVSFISLTLILPAIVPLLASTGAMIPMVKPQFEAGKGRVGKGGVVRDEAVQLECVDQVAECGRSLGLTEAGRLPSPVKGPKGNQEYLLYLVQAPAPTSPGRG